MRRRAPAVYEWLGRLWNATTDKLGNEQMWVWPAAETWQPLLRRITGEYLPYLHQNALAFRAGKKRFDFTGERFAFANTVTTDYRVWCREVLQRRYHALAAAERTRVDEVFAAHGGLQALEADGVIDSGMDERFELPRPALTPAQRRTPLKVALLGQPRN